MKAVSIGTFAPLLATAILLAAGCASRPPAQQKQLMIDGQTLDSLLPTAERTRLDKTIPHGYQGQVLIAQAIGRVLDKHQSLAVGASNAYLAAAGKDHPQLAGWLLLREQDALRVLFIGKQKGAPRVVAVASNLTAKNAKIDQLAQPRTLNAEERALWNARNLAFQAKMTPCSKQYHPVVVPVVAAGVKEIYVYLLPLGPQNKIMLGGYYRIKINAQGTRIIGTHAYTHACLEVERKPKAIGAAVTEAESPAPTAPQVYASLRYGLPIYVTTDANQLRWKVDHGRVELLHNAAQP